MKPIVKLLKLLKLYFFINGATHILILLITHLFPSLLCIKNQYLYHFIIGISTCLFPLLYLYLYEKKEIKNLIKYPSHFPLRTVCTLTAGCFMLVFLLLLHSIHKELGLITTRFPLKFNQKIDVLLNGLFYLSFLVPLKEELLFRVILQRILYNITKHNFFSIILTSLFFSLAHRDFPYLLFYFSMGYFLSSLYQKTEHIIYPILVHAMHNLSIVCSEYFIPDQLIHTMHGYLNPHLSIINRIVLTIACLLLIFFCLNYLAHIKKNLVYPNN